jgi:serine/threonine-protein kinase
MDALQRALGAGIRIERELGGGGMSRVFLATDLSLDRQVVIKVLSTDLSAGLSADRFRREIQLVAKLQHPHVVPIISAGDAEGALYYVMPFLSGESLRARLSREGPLKVPEVVRIAREVLDALAFAHSHGVIHRDIKPENILISGGHAVVADFGVS